MQLNVMFLSCCIDWQSNNFADQMWNVFTFQLKFYFGFSANFAYLSVHFAESVWDTFGPLGETPLK